MYNSSLNFIVLLNHKNWGNIIEDVTIKVKGFRENISFTDYAYGIQLPDWSKLAIKRKNDHYVAIFQLDFIVNFFWPCFVSLVKFRYWSKFHVNIITGSGVMIIFLLKGLTRNPEIGNNPVWVFPNIWRLGQVRNPTCGTNVSNEMLRNAAKWQGYSFYHFWVIKGKPTMGGGDYPPSHAG